MPTPSHARPQRAARELFTNRHRAKSQFLAALDKPQDGAEYRILAWSAPGGQGKTALLEEFERILQRRNEAARSLSAPRPGFALIDFNNGGQRAIATALLSIREQLGRTGGLRFFPAFDTACLRYMLMTQPGTDLKDLRARMFATGSDVLDWLLQAVEAGGELGGLIHGGLPGFSLLSKLTARLAGRAASAVHAWWTASGTRVFADIEELPQDALLRRLPSYLGADLMDILAARRCPRLVVMFDTYEALWRGYGLRDGPGAQRIDDWVRLLVQDAPGVLFVICGRDRLHWPAIDPDAHWDRVIESHTLGGLTQPDADALLRKWDVAEQPIRSRMLAGAWSREYGEVDPADNTTEAYLPFYIDLQAKTYWNIKASGETPKAEDFGGQQPQILARFMEHLDTETDRLLRVASYPGTLDADVLHRLADLLLGGRANADWSRLYARSLVSDERDGTRFLHDLLREALQERERRERPTLYRDTHRALFTWFAARSGSPDTMGVTPAQERALLAAIRHLARFDEPEAVRWANRQMQRLDDAAHWRALEEACLIVLPLAEGNFGPENEWTTAVLSWLASAAGSASRYADAEALYERVRAIDEKALGPEHPSTATTLHELARVYRDTGRYAEAEALYERVRAIREKTLGPEHPSTATTLHNLAGVYSDTGRYAEAEALYERVRAIEEKTLGPEHPSTATTLHNLAGVYCDTGRYAEAEALYERVRAIYEKALGPEHPWTATALANLACVYRDTGRYADAEQLLAVALRLFSTKLPPRHPRIARLLVDRGKLHAACGRKREAADDFSVALADFAAAGVHPDYRWVREACAGLASLGDG